jgi:hypothetical protein
MRERDPLEDWLFLSELIDPKSSELMERQKEISESLDRLAEYLDSDPSEKKKLDEVRLNQWNVAPLAPKDVARAQELYLALVERGGSGNHFVQEGMLSMLALTLDPGSPPFWLKVLGINRPRDAFANRRRTFALAALALLAINRSDPAAYEALRAAARSKNESARGLAVYYLGHAYLDAKREFPEEVVAQLSEIAMYDKAFIPRFHARQALRAANLPTPVDSPDNIYAFKVKFKHAKSIYRVIELTSEQTLEDLRLTIQRAIHWNDNHLYSFFLNGQRWDQKFEYTSSRSEEAERFARDGVIGELGITQGHKFLYLFDYGDSHEFEIEVLSVSPRGKNAKYPRVVESKGKAPAQYPRW